jgi:hypothetical protein
MPGISPFISQRTKRPSKTGVIVLVDSLSTGSAPGLIHIVFLPCQVPASATSRLCISPGVAASMKACMSAGVQPGGNLASAWAAGFSAAGLALVAGLLSFAGSATAIETKHKTAKKAARNRDSAFMGTSNARSENR